MKISIVVDSNIIISALLGGIAADILFRSTFSFVTTDFTIDEVNKYVPEISKRLDISEDKIKKSLTLLPLKVFRKEYYENFSPQAAKMIIDPNDVPVLSLALSLKFPLWTEDRHFDNIKEVLIIKTRELV